MATRSLLPYLAHIVPVKLGHTHLLNIPTEHVCHHNSFWGSGCDSNHAPTFSLKPCILFHGDFGRSFRHISLPWRTPSFPMTINHTFPQYFFQNSPHFGYFLQKQTFQSYHPNTLYTNQKVRTISITRITVQCEESVSLLSLQKY